MAKLIELTLRSLEGPVHVHCPFYGKGSIGRTYDSENEEWVVSSPSTYRVTAMELLLAMPVLKEGLTHGYLACDNEATAKALNASFVPAKSPAAKPKESVLWPAPSISS